MAKVRINKPKDKVAVKQQSTLPTQDEPTNDFDISGRDDPMEKDETELELERLVFGDDEGFREGLKSYREDAGYLGSGGNEGEEGEDISSAHSETEEQNLDALEDADLFFIDSGPSIPASAVVPVQALDDEDEETKDARPPAWIDSDDERLTVSLASNPRLRKLRISENEDLVNGKEYSKRLRQQFERLNPVPEWARPSAPKTPSARHKRRKLSNASSSASDGSASDISIDTDDLSAQPLAKLLQSTAPLTQTSASARKKLRPEVIDIQRTKDVAGVQPSAITSLSFHPHHPLLLSSGPSATLTLTHISPSAPRPNPVLTSLHIPHHPLETSRFAPPAGERIFFSARRRYFHIWDLPTGQIQKVSRIYGHAEEQRSMERFKLSPDGRWMGLVGSSRKGGGVVNVLDAKTSQWVCQVRVDGRGGIADFDWWSDGDGLVVVGKGGEAVEYSMSERKAVGRWMDDGAVGITVVALGGTRHAATTAGGEGSKSNGSAKSKNGLGGDRYVVVGSQAGIVNIYDRAGWRAGAVPERPKPARVLDQLVTPISHLCFSPDGQMVVMASRWKRDALRLVHLPSCTVYKNWPTANTPLGRITAVAVSANSEMLAVANEQGKIRLWEIRA